MNRQVRTSIEVKKIKANDEKKTTDEKSHKRNLNVLTEGVNKKTNEKSKEISIKKRTLENSILKMIR